MTLHQTSGFLSSISQLDSIAADLKPLETIASVATLIIYSMTEDIPPLSPSDASAPPSGTATPASAVPLAGSHALDSLHKFLQATETFYHPSNYGEWTMLLNKLTQNLSAEFLRRWTVSVKSSSRSHILTNVCQRMSKSQNAKHLHNGDSLLD